MPSNPTSNLPESLSAVLRRLDGAVDFWTLVCLEEVVPDRHAFVQTEIDHLRCDLNELTRQLAVTAAAPGQAEWWGTVCDTLELVFAVLMRYRDFSTTERGSAIRLFSQVYQAAYQAAHDVAAANRLAVDHLDRRAPDHDHYYREVFDRLTDQFEARCGSSETAGAARK
jgi:hypothetical protein